MLYSPCTVQTQPRKGAVDHAAFSAPTRQHELDHADQESICPTYLDHEAEVDDLSDVRNGSLHQNTLPLLGTGVADRGTSDCS